MLYDVYMPKKSKDKVEPKAAKDGAISTNFFPRQRGWTQTIFYANWKDGTFSRASGVEPIPDIFRWVYENFCVNLQYYFSFCFFIFPFGSGLLST